MPRWPKIPQFNPPPWIQMETTSNTDSSDLEPTQTTATISDTTYPSSNYTEQTHSTSLNSSATTYPSSLHTTYTHVSDTIGSDDIEVDVQPNYEDILEELCKEWLLVEIKHKVSKAASNEFWRLAIDKLKTVIQTSDKKIAQFQQQRRKLQKKYVPDISLNVAYACNETDEIHEITNTNSIPVKQYPRDCYTKQYETASIKVTQ